MITHQTDQALDEGERFYLSNIWENLRFLLALFRSGKVNESPRYRWAHGRCFFPNMNGDRIQMFSAGVYFKWHLYSLVVKWVKSQYLHKKWPAYFPVTVLFTTFNKLHIIQTKITLGKKTHHTGTMTAKCGSIENIFSALYCFSF